MWFMPDRMACRCAALLVLGACALGLVGCGFQPLYGQSGAGSSENLAAIQIDQIADRMGQRMRNLLFDKLTPRGAPDRPLYRLSVSLRESKQELAIRKDESATRANLTVIANFSLSVIQRPDIGTLSGTAASTNSYNVLQSEYATLSAENDARIRALAVLAEEIRLRVAAGLRNPLLFVPPAPEGPR